MMKLAATATIQAGTLAKLWQCGATGMLALGRPGSAFTRFAMAAKLPDRITEVCTPRGLNPIPPLTELVAEASLTITAGEGFHRAPPIPTAFANPTLSRI